MRKYGITANTGSRQNETQEPSRVMSGQTDRQTARGGGGEGSKRGRERVGVHNRAVPAHPNLSGAITQPFSHSL